GTGSWARAGIAQPAVAAAAAVRKRRRFGFFMRTFFMSVGVGCMGVSPRSARRRLCSQAVEAALEFGDGEDLGAVAFEPFAVEHDAIALQPWLGVLDDGLPVPHAAQRLEAVLARLLTQCLRQKLGEIQHLERLGLLQADEGHVAAVIERDQGVCAGGANPLYQMPMLMRL